MEKSKLITFGDLSLELKINKSQLAYYYKEGLLKKHSTIGNTNVFDKEQTIKDFKRIVQLQKGGYSLKKIKEMI